MTEKSTEEDVDYDPPSMIMEDAMLDDYFLLVRRIPGISLSINEYWELDTFTTQKLLGLELEIMEKEEKQLKEAQGKKEYVEQPEGNSEEMNDLMDDMSVDE